MSHFMDYFKGKTNTDVGYDATEPSICQYGRSASFTVYIEDSYMEVEVEFGYDFCRDEITIDSVYSENYDEDCSACDLTEIDLRALFDDVSNKHGTLDKAYHLQAQHYIAVHEEY